MASDSISIPRPVVIGGAASFAVVALMAAYWAGRAQTPPAPVVIAAPAVTSTAAPPSTSPLPAAPPDTASAAVASMTGAPTPVDSPVPTSPQTTPPTPVAPPPSTPPTAKAAAAPNDDPDKAAVRKYFEEVERVAATGMGVGDPNRTAAALLNQDSAGGTSAGVDQLLADQKRIRDEVAKVHAPPPCSEHQRRMLSAMDQGMKMLDELGSAMRKGETSSLARIAGKARTIEEESRAVDTIAGEVKAKYGL